MCFIDVNNMVIRVIETAAMIKLLLGFNRLCLLSNRRAGLTSLVWFGLLGFNASATARVISRR